MQSDCVDNESAYRIVQVTTRPEGCVADVDRRYYRGFPDGRSFTLCLDYNWRDNLCIAIGPHDAYSYVCGQRSRNASGPGYRLGEIHSDEINKKVCGQDPSITHETRKYLVCLKKE
ncbi:hypothetical protein MTP03_32890 [Tsukamurella sp. PLM1]|nr:hypothetical protein MTP03_32890 [Tsukamurella sp. PLM1]